MQSQRMHTTSLSGRRALALLLRLGVLIFLIAVVAHWPFQSFVVYLGLVVLVSLGVVVEFWEHRRATRGLKFVITLPPDEYVDRDATGSH